MSAQQDYANSKIEHAMRSVQAAIPQAEADPTRPVYHFRPPAQWMNDPNGTIYHNGFYHVFYQHNPYGDQWGYMHWGHTYSKDLVHWEHLPVALWPSEESGEEHCFSGCTTINDKGQPMIFYTSIGSEKQPREGAEQWAALGDENLLVWNKHPANPVLTEKVHRNTKIYEWRDPFIFQEQGRTFIVLGGKLDQTKGSHPVVALYEAKNKELTDWIYRGVLFRHPNKELRSLECPNLFKLDTTWVLFVSPYDPVEYFIGTFNLDTFSFEVESEGVLDHSTHFGATNILFDETGRCVVFGWVRFQKGQSWDGQFPKGKGWNGCLSLPRVLSIDPDKRMVQKPISELKKLRGKHYQASDISLVNTSRQLEEVEGTTLEILAEVEPVNSRTFGIRLRRPDGSIAGLIVYNGNLLKVVDISIPLVLDAEERVIRLHVFVDKSVLEVYANNRECVTQIINSGADNLKVELFAQEGKINIRALDVWNINSIW